MNKVALITGGTSGIGRATVIKFLKEGYKVVALSLGNDKEAIESSLEEFKKHGQAIHIAADVTNIEDNENALEETLEEFGQIDVLVNCAGIVGEQKDLIDLDTDLIKSVIDVNLLGTIYLTKLVLPHMIERKQGTIVNIGSIDGFIANHENIAYHASKGGVKMFTQAVAKEVSTHGVRVLSVAPGWVKTAIIDKQVEENGDELLVTGGQMHMKGRIIEPEEIAGVIWLSTLSEASAINGTTIMADDGYSAFKGVDIETDI